MDAVVADVAHEAGELAERVRLPPSVAGQAVAERGGDRALELRSAVAVDKRVHLGECRPQALSGGVPGALDGSAEQAGRGQEHAAPVGLDRLAEAALGPRVESEAGEVGDEHVRFQAPKALLPEAVRQLDDIREHGRLVQSQTLPCWVPG